MPKVTNSVVPPFSIPFLPASWQINAFLKHFTIYLKKKTKHDKLKFPIHFLLGVCCFKIPALRVLALRIWFGSEDLALSTGKVNRGAGVDGYVLRMFVSAESPVECFP